MNDQAPYGDALTRDFWSAASRHKLVMQLCQGCRRYQFYPRPFCLSCGSQRLQWAEVSGHGTVYAITTVHKTQDAAFTPPYIVAIVELDEGPRLLTQITGQPALIGDRVRLEWHERAGLPPLPFFARSSGT